MIPVSLPFESHHTTQITMTPIFTKRHRFNFALSMIASLLILSGTVLAAEWHSIDTNNGHIDSIWDQITPAYTDDVNNTDIYDKDELKQAWYAYDGDAIYFKFTSWHSTDILYSDFKQGVAAIDCNENNLFDDADDRKIIFLNNGDVQITSGDAATTIITRADWGEQDGPTIEWQGPLKYLPVACRGSLHPVSIKLFIQRNSDNVIMSQADGTYTIDNPMDFGDAGNWVDPGSQTCQDYSTLLFCNGPRHGITPLHLGAHVDADSGELQNSRATADDLDNSADEDGVAPRQGETWVAGGQGHLDVTVSGGYGNLNCWVDWNRDQDFAANELIIDDSLVGSGYQMLTTTIPAFVTFDGPYMARCRVAAGPDLATMPEGAVMSGEVEDYDWLILSPQPTISTPSLDLVFQWPYLSQDDEEQVYKSDSPYFRREDATSLGWSGTSGTATDYAVLGLPADTFFYQVIGSKSVDGDQLYSTPSKEMGLFEFELVVGTS